MLFDPLYLLVMGVGLLLSLGASAWVKGAIGHWARVPTRAGLTGRDVAHAILAQSRVRGVRVEPVGGWLSDHYDPTSRTLRLSPQNYAGRSVAAVGIAAHEVGHALQDAEGYWPMRLRQRLVPAANLGTSLGVFLAVVGMAVGALDLARLGVVLFGAFVAFTLITLPVELDASRRAYAQLANAGILARQELGGVRHVLTAAAATYLAAAVTALLQLLYFLLRAGMVGRSE